MCRRSNLVRRLLGKRAVLVKRYPWSIYADHVVYVD
jgi:hypothetical protein